MKNIFWFVCLFILIYLISPVSGQVHIAVIEFAGKGLSEMEASILSDRLRTELFRTGGFVVLEREMMEEILTEQGFQQTGCTTTQCYVEMGKMIGVEQIVAGSASKFGNLYSLSARTISVETGQISNTATYDHEGRLEDLLKIGMKNIANQLATGVMPIVDKPSVSDVVEMNDVQEPSEESSSKKRSGMTSWLKKSGRMLISSRETGLYLHPKAGWGQSSDGDYFSFGGNIGYRTKNWGSLGLDVSWIGETSFNFLLVYELIHKKYIFQLGYGLIEDSKWNDGDGDWNYYDSNGIRIGIGRTIFIKRRFPLTPVLELNFGLDDARAGNGSLNFVFGYSL